MIWNVGNKEKDRWISRIVIVTLDESKKTAVVFSDQGQEKAFPFTLVDAARKVATKLNMELVPVES
jgi:hypothetical protein